MAYPPVPYPALSHSGPRESAEPPRGSPRALVDEKDEEHQSTRSNTHITPTPALSSRSPFPSLRSTPSSSRQLKSSNSPSDGRAASPATFPTSPTPASPAASSQPRIPLPSTSSTFSSSPSKPSRSSHSTAIELTRLERQVTRLREAKRIQQATEKGAKDGDDELKRRCEKWEAAEKVVLEVLHARVGSPDPLSPTNSALSSHLSANSTFTPFPFPSRTRSIADLVSSYTASLDAQAQQRGISTSKLLEEIDERERDEQSGEEELEALEVVMRKGKRRVAGRGAGRETEGGENGGKKVRRHGAEEEKASEVEEESDDEVMEALDKLISGAGAGEGS